MEETRTCQLDAWTRTKPTQLGQGVGGGRPLGPPHVLI